MRKLMILDPEQNYAPHIYHAFQDLLTICVNSQWNDPIAEILYFNPDYLILNFASSLYDGFSLLRQLQSKGIRPIVLAVLQRSNVYTNFLLDELQVTSVLYAPFSPNTLNSNLSNLLSLPKEKLIPLPTRTQYLCYHFTTLGMHTDSYGVKALISIIPRYEKHPQLCFTKELYPDCGKPSGHTSQQVERNIRSAIEVGWKQQDKYPWKDYFPSDENGYVTRPNNSEFIKLFAKILTSQRGQYQDEEI